MTSLAAVDFSARGDGGRRPPELTAQPNKTLRRPSWALFFTERHKGSERAFGFNLGAKARSDDDKAVLVGFQNNPAFSNGAVRVEPDGDGARRHVPS